MSVGKIAILVMRQGCGKDLMGATRDDAQNLFFNHGWTRMDYAVHSLFLTTKNTKGHEILFFGLLGLNVNASSPKARIPKTSTEEKNLCIGC